MKYTLLFLAICFYATKITAQCPVGELEVTVEITTDEWSSEGYWELLPSGNNCGTGTIESGGNSLVGCNGAGQQNNFNGGYNPHQTITSASHCLTQGATYDIFYADDYGDGGFVFVIKINGYPVYEMTASGDAPGSRLTFTADLPPAYDLSCREIKSPLYVDLGNVL